MTDKSIDTILSSNSTKNTKKTRFDKDYSDIHDVLEHDLMYIGSKLLSLEQHVSNLDSIIDRLNILIKHETDNIKKAAYYKGINSNLRLIAELSDVIQKFATIRLKYRTEQSSVVHRQKLMDLKDSTSKSSVTVSDLIELLRNLPKSTNNESDISENNIEIYNQIQKDLDIDTYSMT